MRTITVILIALFSFNVSNGQTIGKIFDKDYADKEFGNVIKSVTIANDNLNEMLKTSGKYIMLNIDTGTIRAIDAQRKTIQGSANSPEEIFYNMSTSQVELLLSDGLQNTTQIEMRPKTMTLTNGQFTLEFTKPCPPYCP